MAAQHLVLASLELKLAPMEMRRSLPAQLVRLLRLSWFNQRIVEAITNPMSPYEESVRVVERPILGRKADKNRPRHLEPQNQF